MITIEKINEYLSRHLQNKAWESFSSEEQEQAVNMANLDIAGELNDIDLNDDNYLEVYAVAEQALHLLMNNEAVTPPNSSDVLSEAIEGLGSVSYGVKKDNKFISYRSQVYIKRRKHQLFSNTLTRG